MRGAAMRAAGHSAATSANARAGPRRWRGPGRPAPAPAPRYHDVPTPASGLVGDPTGARGCPAWPLTGTGRAPHPTGPGRTPGHRGTVARPRPARADGQEARTGRPPDNRTRPEVDGNAPHPCPDTAFRGMRTQGFPLPPSHQRRGFLLRTPTDSDGISGSSAFTHDAGAPRGGAVKIPDRAVDPGFRVRPRTRPPRTLPVRPAADAVPVRPEKASRRTGSGRLSEALPSHHVHLFRRRETHP